MSIYNDFTTPETIVTDVKAINNSIKNILFTPLGSLPGKPRFGSRLNEIMFNQLDSITSNLLRRLITEAIRDWEPRVIVTNVDVKPVPEYNKLIATIEYRYKDAGLDINEQISLSLTQ